MTKIVALLLICTFSFISLSLSNNNESNSTIKIEWVKNLVGDFGFHHEWSYPEGVFLNEFNQLSCDGLCPPEIERMLDSSGRILKDSIAPFYQQLDTTHQLHSLEGEAWCYEYAGTHFMNFSNKEGKEIIGKSLYNAATHVALEIKVIGNFCTPTLFLNAISSGLKHRFLLAEGSIQIDPFYFKKGVIKAIFNFKFDNDLQPSDQLFWKGKIYSTIIQEGVND